jgi:uracil-DNA glycosylase family 4|tara:strand:- start:1027 stop:1779 length:753 start_codon:yes stop_codon:yes gene_type:complete
MTEPPNGPDIPSGGPKSTGGDKHIVELFSIEEVAAAVRTCTRCGLAETRINAVPGEGSDSPSILFIGEGPGANEDEQGRPFVGRAGKLLDELLGVVPLLRSDVHITNVVKCRPPGNRDPLPGEVRACWPYLEAQIGLLKPHVIATLGRHAMNRFLPNARISDQHGRATVWRDIVIFPLYHPAAALRSTTLRQTLENDIRRLPEAVLQSLEMNATRSQAPSGTNGSVPTDTTSLTSTESSIKDETHQDRLF